MNQSDTRGLTSLARRLVLNSVLTAEQAKNAIAESAEQGDSLAVYLVGKKLVQPAAVALAYAQEFGASVFDASALNLKFAPVKLVSEKLIEKHQVLPLFKRGGVLFIGVSDPTNIKALDEIRFQTNSTVEPVLVDPDTLKRAIESAYAQTDSFADALSDAEGLDNLEVGDADDDEDDAAGVGISDDDTPIVKFVNKILVDGIRRGASDIHFEPYEDFYRVRYRLDGVLSTVAKPPVKLSTRIASRLKVMSSLDIAEKRIPQDGRIKLNLSKTRSMDFRVSTCPTLFGEKVVLRILDGGAAKMGIDMLGYEEDQKELYLKALANPYGMILVTGPTGSGKTVSLYTGLNILNTGETNISTAEDPVEIRVAGINQVQQNAKRGMTFAAALRSFLRQDPDVIMVGEIRDLETAEIAIKAAQTGHLVLSTLHTNDAPQTVARLMNMGIAPYNITSSVTLVIAQRLARRLHSCKKEIKLPDNALLAEGFTQEEIDEGFKLYEAVGCDQCNEGYKGRVGIYQVMPMLEPIQKIVLEGGNALQIAKAAEAAGVRDLRTSALWKVKQGITSLAEINRVTKD